VAVAQDHAAEASAPAVEPPPVPVRAGQPVPPGAAEAAAMDAEPAAKETDFDEFFQRDDQDLYSALYAEEPSAGRRWLLPMAAVAGVVIAVGLALLLTADGDTTQEKPPAAEETEAPEPVVEPTAEEVAAIELAASETAARSETTALQIGAATSLDRLVHIMAWDGVDTTPAAPAPPGEEETPESPEATAVAEVEASPVEPELGEPEEEEEPAEREPDEEEERAEREAREREERAEREAREREERAEREAREEEEEARREARARRAERERRQEEEEEVDRLDPEDALDRARDEFERGRYGEAAAAARQLLDADSGNADALELLGRSLYEMGEAREAIPVLRQASRANRRDTDLLLLLGSAQQETNDVAGARESYQQYLEREPEGPLAEDIRNILEQL
jgi:TolA-binding protein